jgi:hypothetical protein
MSTCRDALTAIVSGALLTVLPSMLLGGSADAAGLFVPSEMANLQLAIDTAVRGDTVFVEAGTYTGPGNKNLTFRGKSIVVFGIDGAEATIIDCEGNVSRNARGFVFESGEPSSAVVEGLTIRNGHRSGSVYPVGYGGGMLITNEGTNPKIKNCRFEDNFAGHAGGGVAAGDDAEPSFFNCVFLGNRSPQGAGAHASSNAYFIECAFLDNDASGAGGGLRCYSTNTPVVRDCFFRDNIAWAGGGIASIIATPMVAQCFFSRNFSTEGGGSAVYSRAEANVTLSSCVFIDNSARGETGGTVTCSNAEASLDRCTLFSNKASVGAGIYLKEGGFIHVENTIIAFNEVGEGVACESGTPVLRCTDVFGNEGGDWVGCIAAQARMNRNMATDPLFCNMGVGNLRLAETSPCSADHAGSCGQIGRYGVGCVSTVEETTWGSLKALYGQSRR